MSKRRILRRSALLIVTGLGALALYEGYRISKATSVADARFEQILSEARLNATDLTPEQKHILLTVEDPGFETHKGIDLRTPGGGMTTITQALTKRVFFENFKPGFAKIEQSLIARYVVHSKLSKNDQLTVFLNIAYFGNCEGQQIEGFVDASECYLGKSFDELSDQDFINLTARLIGPNKYNRDTEALDERIRKINRLVSGACEPNGNRDVTYEAC